MLASLHRCVQHIQPVKNVHKVWQLRWPQGASKYCARSDFASTRNVFTSGSNLYWWCKTRPLFPSFMYILLEKQLNTPNTQMMPCLCFFLGNNPISRIGPTAYEGGVHNVFAHRFILWLLTFLGIISPPFSAITHILGLRHKCQYATDACQIEYESWLPVHYKQAEWKQLLFMENYIRQLQGAKKVGGKRGELVLAHGNTCPIRFPTVQTIVLLGEM